MEVKINTKERFNVLVVMEPELSDIMADELKAACYSVLEQEIKNVVINLQEVKAMGKIIAEALVGLQQQFYDKQASFVICKIQPPVEQVLKDADLLEMLNIAPTESEAGDIVQMEEIERELLKEEDSE